MKLLDIRLQEVIKLMKEIDARANKQFKVQVKEDLLKTGYQSSKLSSGQATTVPMSPLMKNALIHYGDLTEDSKKRLTVNDPQTRAEKAIVANMKQLLLRFNGSSDKFNTNLGPFDVSHYNVQCHQNMKENLRDIQPGQAEQRRKMVKVYREPTKMTTSDIISKIYRDRVFQKAIIMVLDMMPTVRASNEIRKINLPFMTKHSGVGYPYWRNDRSISPDGRTYAEVTMDEASRLKDDYSSWLQYNVSTLYGRNQRGKGRMLIATSRVLNLLLNQIESVEINSYKERFPWFLAYNNAEVLKQGLIKMGEYCEKNGLWCSNEDFSSYDSTVSSGLVTLLGALSVMKANGARSKTIAYMRAVAARSTGLVDGLNDTYDTVYGRIFSGFIDTNRGGGLINGLVTLYLCMLQDEEYSHIIYDCKDSMFVMGDDNSSIKSPKINRKQFVKDAESHFNMIINEEKFEYGPMMVQYRVFKDPKTHEYVMAYAWPRVVRSMLMKEEAKGLGPVGWTYSWYQAFGKLLEYPEALSIAVNLLAPFDQNKFFMDVPISKLNEMLQKEDDEARSKLKTDAQKRQYLSTKDKLYDGDPAKDGMLADNFLQKVQQAIKAVYDPDFYNKFGLR